MVIRCRSRVLDRNVSEALPGITNTLHVQTKFALPTTVEFATVHTYLFAVLLKGFSIQSNIPSMQPTQLSSPALLWNVKS